MTDAPDAAQLNPTQRLVVAIAVLASFVAFLDGTIVNVALPAISRELGGGLTTQQWVVDAYLITLGALMLLAGSVADAYGRILVMRIGLIGFGVSSLVIAAAVDPTMMITGRILQGAAGAFLVPSSLALITSNISGPSQGKAIGQWTAFTTGAMVVGPLLGGVFVDYLSWRYAFVINVLPIALTLWLLTRLPIRDERRPDARIDWLGAALCTVGLGASVTALIEQPNLGFGSPLFWALLVGGLVVFAAFLLRQRSTPDPLLPLELFRIRNFWAGNLSTLFIYAALSLNGFVVGVYLQQGAGLTATLAGLASLPTTIITVFLSARIGALAGRFGPRWFMAAGPIIMSIGSLMLLMISDDFDYWWQVLPAMIVFGFGIAITVSPLTTAILGAVDSSRSGTASAVNNAVSRIAGLLVIAVLSTIVGHSVDLAGLHNAAYVMAALLAAGGITAGLWIRNPRRG